MWKNALFATAVVLMGAVLWLMGELEFLSRYRTVLLRDYSRMFGVWLGLLAVNLFCGFFWLTQKMFLRDTGRKLKHVEKQMRGGSIAEELGARLNSEL